LMGAIGSAVEYALILSVTVISPKDYQQNPMPKVIVRVWINFSEPAQHPPSGMLIDCDALH